MLYVEICSKIATSIKAGASHFSHKHRGTHFVLNCQGTTGSPGRMFCLPLPIFEHFILHCLVPRYLPLDPSSAQPPFFPLDLVLYRRSKQKSAPTLLERNQRANEYFHSVLGDQPFRTPEGEPAYRCLR